MVEELENVVLTRDIRESGLSGGDVGTVVHRYESGKGYVVEFVSGEGRTVAVLTLARKISDRLRTGTCSTYASLPPANPQLPHVTTKLPGVESGLAV